MPRLLRLLTAVLLSLGLVAGLPTAASVAASEIDVFVTFEGYNLGQGYYVEPVRLTVPEGSTAAAVTETLLRSTSHDFKAWNAGDTSNTEWYLAGVKGFDTGTATAPPYITGQPGFELTGNDGDAYLGTPDYNSMSGWMYTVGNVAADVGAGAYELHDGDVMRWQFTLYGTGCDLGLPSACYEGTPYFTMIDKSELIRAIAKGVTATATAAELASARTTAVNPTATQQQVTDALTALTTSSWLRLTTTAQGQLLSALRAKLVSDYGQTEGDYDYSVVRRLGVSGTLNSQDYADLRNVAYAGGSIRKLDLSGVVDSTTYPLSGMTALTDVSLPPVGSYTLANPFQGDVSLRNVVVAAETYAFGSTTTFNGITGLQRITFLHTTKPSMNASTFAGSNNADAGSRVVTAVVPDRARGDYDKASFTDYFAGVAEAAGTDDLAELQNVIDDAAGITHDSAAAEFRWTLLQKALATATAVQGSSAPTSAAVYRARLVLQTAVDRVGVAGLGLSLKVTHGAEVTLSWKNGTAQHYAEFTPRPVAKVDAFSDDDYDVYVPTTTMPYVTQNIASAVIPGETDKVAKIFTTSAATAGAQHTLALTPLAQRQDTALSIPGLGAGDNRGLYTNLDDTGVVNLDVGDHFDLDTFRTQQAQLDQVNNLFVEPDYTFDVSGDSITTRSVGRDGRRQLRITAERPGVSVIKITYGPLHYLAANDNGTPGNTNWSFNGIDRQNTGLAVVNVGGDMGTFDSGIDVRNELDTYYFDKTTGSRPFTFTPATGTTVRVHDPLNVKAWGTGWKTYQPAEDGSFTVKLKGGRNIVELTNDGKVEYRVVRAKGVDVTVTNTTDPGRPFAAGDNARIAITGIEGGVEKLAGIYNPAFSAGTKGKLTYYDGGNQLVSNEAPQYQTAVTTFNVDYTYTGDTDKALEGDMFIGGLGAEWPYHRRIPLEGKPANLAAVAIGPYHFGSLPTIYVHGDQVSTRPEGALPPADKSALNAAIAAAEGRKEPDYTASSWSALRAALVDARAVAADEGATQTEADQATAAVDDALAGLAMKGTAPPAPAVTADTTAAQRAGAGWLAAELAANDDVLGSTPTDWGLTIDAVFALAGAGVGGDQIAETADAVYHSGEDYVGAPGQVAFTWPYVAKTVLALEIAGLDPTTFPAGSGTRDLVADLRSSIRPNGAWTNAADAFKTSLGILALARTDEGVPAVAVTKFEELACADSVHANYGAFGFVAGCGSADVDTTAMAVQALLAAGVGRNDPAVARATDWMIRQKPEDGFPSAWGPGNTNTSGLAAQALFGAERTTEARKAASFIQGLQIGCSTASDENVTDPDVVASLRRARGAIAWNAGSRATALEDGLDAASLGQWRRATAQAVLGLGAPTLGFVTAADAEPETPSLTCPTAPETPAKPGTTLVGKSITVSWTPPADGDSPITGYTVVLSPADGTPATRTAAADVTSVVFEDVPPGTYTATVAATNGIGTSPASPASEPVVIEPDPDPVVGTSVTVRGAQVIYGRAGQVDVTVTAASGTSTPPGSVSAQVGTQTITGTLVGGTATITLPARSLAPGTRSLTIAYAGVDGRFTGSSATVSMSVLKATPTVKVKGPKKVRRGRTATYTVTVTAPGVQATGRVRVTVAGKSRTVALSPRGKAVVKVATARKAKLGKRAVTVAYAGDAFVDSGRVTRFKTRVIR